MDALESCHSAILGSVMTDLIERLEAQQAEIERLNRHITDLQELRRGDKRAPLDRLMEPSEGMLEAMQEAAEDFLFKETFETIASDERAKRSNTGSLQAAIRQFRKENDLG